jgi:hypothetical protein
LLKLWEQRDRNRITWESYKRLGGGRLALARSADQLYEGLIPEEQVTARRILLRLVRPGEGLEVTSNGVRLAVFYQRGEARDRVDRVLQRLVKADLLRLTTGERPEDNQVEVAHEALVRNWPRLVGWLEDERERIRERLRVTEAAEQWLKVGRDPGALLRGALLEDALRYSDLSELEQHYIKASQSAVAAVEQEKEAARQRELEQARALAAEQERLVKSERHWATFQEQTVVKLRQRALWLGVITTAAVLLAVAAVWFSFEANRHSAEANAARTEAVQQAATAQAAQVVAQMEAATAQAAEAELRTKQERLSHLSAALNYTSEQLDALEAILRNISATVNPITQDVPPEDRSYATPTAPLVEQPLPVSPAPYATPAATPTAAVIASVPPTNTLVVTDEVVATATEGASDAGDEPPADNLAITELPVMSVLSQTPITAIVPDIEINLYAEASEKSPVLRTLRAPDQLTVLQADAYWVKVITDDGTAGWVEAYALTYTGDAARLPIALQYRVAAVPDPIQNESKTPFTYGVIISVENATVYPLLDDLQNPTSVLIDTPVDTPVTLLFETTGPTAYGSDRWYYVQLSDPNGRNLLHQGYLPAAVIAQR